MINKSKFITAAPAVLAFIPSQIAAKTSDAVPYCYQNDFEGYSEPLLLRKSNNTSEEANTSTFRVITARWNNALEARFDDLAIKHALGEITHNEQIELDKIQIIRIQELSRRSYEEVMREFEIEKATKNALDAINELSRAVTNYWPSTVKEKKA